MIKDILLMQKRELEKRLAEWYIEREIDYKKFDNDLIKVIIGPRRAGKSFICFHILNRSGNFGYANFDDEKLVETENYDEIINAIDSIYDKPKNILFDEIQNLPKWELFVNRIQRQGYNLIITGSNSKLLSRELATHLTGRHMPINIFPFSFAEFLQLDNKELTESETKSKLSDYVTKGGYPEPCIKKIDYKDYLSVLYDSIIFKDIVKKYNIRFISGIEDLAIYLISNTTKEFSYNTLTKVTRCKSVHTVEKYLNYLEESFVLFKLDRFSYKIREQISSNKKIYCIDNGFIHSKAFGFSPDIGKLYENVVAVDLKKMEIDGKLKMYFWKNSQQEEVDFVVKHGAKITQLIQVCYDIKNTKTKEREKRVLLKASKELGCDILLVINGDCESEEEIEWYGEKRKIKFIPLWKWLLRR